MAKAVYIGNNNSKKVKKMYLGNGTSHKVKKGYIGVDGLAKLFFSGATVWKKYNAVENHTYHWNRFNRVTKTTYKWNRYNINSVTTYTWKKYRITESYTIRLTKDTLSFKWYENDNPYEKVYRSARATGVGSRAISLSGLVTITPSNYDKLVGYYTTTGHGRFYKITEFSRYEGSSAKYMGTRIEGTKGSSSHTYIGTVSSTNPSAYPNGGSQDGYYYDSRTSKTDQSQGSLIDQVTSTSSSAYPQNGISGSYWYVAAGSDTTYSKGAAAGEVTSSNRGAYPDNNYSGNYWYVFARDEITYTRGSYIQDVENDNPNAYPSNGRHSDGYWYVLQLE